MTAAMDASFECLSKLAKRGAAWRKYAEANGLSGNWSRAWRYSMSPQDLHALYLRQDGRCYLCGDLLPKNLTKTAVEHDHSCCPGIGRKQAAGDRISCGLCVRGIACASCNRLIAAANDDPDRLRRIADNLEEANRRTSRGPYGQLVRFPGPNARRREDPKTS